MNNFYNSEVNDLKNLILNIKSIIKRRWLMFFIVSSLVSSILFTISPTRSYVSSYNIVFNVDDKPGLYDVAMDQCSHIEDLFENFSYSEVSTLLNIDFPVSSIISFESKPYSGNANSNYLPSSINIKITHTDTTHSLMFIQKVLEYLKNNEFISKWHNGMNLRRDRIYNETKKDLRLIDSLLNQDIKRVTEIEGIDGILVHRHNLVNSIATMEFKNLQTESFYLVTGKNDSLVMDSNFERLIKILSFGFLVSFLLVFLLEIIRFVKRISIS